MNTAQLINGNMRENGVEVNLEKTKNLELNKIVNGIEGDGTTFAMNTQSIQEMAQTEAKAKYNNKVQDYIDKFESHKQLLDEYTNSVLKDLDHLEIKPVFEGILIKPYDENPFQKIKVEGGIITDLGGQKPTYKSKETGEVEEEEQFVHTGLVLDVGPKVQYIQEGDVVFWRKPSELPIPFFKQGLVLVSEHSIVSVVNAGLTERFNKIKETNDE